MSKRKSSKRRTVPPVRSQFTVLRQMCNLIPGHLISKLAREQGAEALARTFSYWSQLVALLFAQLTHAIGLNDVCDSLTLHSGPLSAVRGATPPSRNNFSHANRTRPADIAQKLFWQVLAHLQNLHPAFAGAACGGRKLARRFKCAIHVVDATTIQLVAQCMDWARHRRRSRSPGGGAETDCEARAARRAKEP